MALYRKAKYEKNMFISTQDPIYYYWDVLQPNFQYLFTSQTREGWFIFLSFHSFYSLLLLLFVIILHNDNKNIDSKISRKNWMIRLLMRSTVLFSGRLLLFIVVISPVQYAGVYLRVSIGDEKRAFAVPHTHAHTISRDKSIKQYLNMVSVHARRARTLRTTNPSSFQRSSCHRNCSTIFNRRYKRMNVIWFIHSSSAIAR